MLPSPSLIRFAVRALRIAPIGAARTLARVAGTLGYFGARARRKTLLENLAHLAPETSLAQRRRLARQTFVNLLDASVDLFRLPTAARSEIRALIELRGREHLDAALRLGRGVVMVTPHLGPYELGGAYLAVEGYPVHAMVEDIDPETNAALALYRESTGMRLLSRSRGIRGALTVLKKGEILILVADRVIGDGSDGVVLPMGSGRRSFPTGPASFALATGAPVIVGGITRNIGGTARYLITLEPPIVPESTGHQANDRHRLTTHLAERLAAMVRAHPDQWFVFQPGWSRRDAS